MALLVPRRPSIAVPPTRLRAALPSSRDALRHGRPAGARIGAAALFALGILLTGCSDTPAPETPPAPQLSALATMGRPPTDADYPNLADVPPRPDFLPTPGQRQALQSELEADRQALAEGRPSTLAGSAPEGLAGLPAGDIAELDRRRLVTSRVCSGCDLRRSNLAGLDLHEAILGRSDLSQANLSGANLRNADLTATNLRGASLRGANLTDARLTGATLTGTDLSGAVLCATTMPDGEIDDSGCPPDAQPEAR